MKYLTAVPVLEVLEALEVFPCWELRGLPPLVLAPLFHWSDLEVLQTKLVHEVT